MGLVGGALSLVLFGLFFTGWWLLAIGVVIIRFELNTDKHTKTTRVRGREVLQSFVFTPDTCGGKWKTQAKAQYSDGTTQTIKDDQSCKRPG